MDIGPEEVQAAPPNGGYMVHSDVQQQQMQPGASPWWEQNKRTVMAVGLGAVALGAGYLIYKAAKK
jgi:hypothetical protein